MPTGIREKFKVELRMDLRARRAFDELLDKTSQLKHALTIEAGRLVEHIGAVPTPEVLVSHAAVKEAVGWIPSWSLNQLAKDALEKWAEGVLLGVKRRNTITAALPLEPSTIHFSTSAESVRLPILDMTVPCRRNTKILPDWTVEGPKGGYGELQARISRIELAILNNERCLLIHTPSGVST